MYSSVLLLCSFLWTFYVCVCVCAILLILIKKKVYHRRSELKKYFLYIPMTVLCCRKRSLPWVWRCYLAGLTTLQWAWRDGRTYEVCIPVTTGLLSLVYQRHSASLSVTDRVLLWCCIHFTTLLVVSPSGLLGSLLQSIYRAWLCFWSGYWWIVETCHIFQETPGVVGRYRACVSVSFWPQSKRPEGFWCLILKNIKLWMNFMDLFISWFIFLWTYIYIYIDCLLFFVLNILAFLNVISVAVRDDYNRFF